MYNILPYNDLLIKGVFLDFESMLFFVKLISLFKSAITISAKNPVLISPALIFNHLAGAEDILVINNSKLISPFKTSSVYREANAVSKPLIPKGAKSNYFSFSWSECGAWSVAIKSIVPSIRPFIKDFLSLSALIGGLHLKFVSKVTKLSSLNIK